MALLSTSTDGEFCAAVGVEPEVYSRFQTELRYPKLKGILR